MYSLLCGHRLFAISEEYAGTDAGDAYHPNVGEHPTISQNLGI